MKPFLLLFLIIVGLLTSTVFAEIAPTVEVKPMPTSVKNPDAPKLEDADSFSIILLGDPQSYIKYDVNQPLFEYMVAWTAAQKDILNVKTVICTGDLVEQNNMLISSGGTKYEPAENGNQPSALQWKAVSRAFERIDNVYPYILVTGNHDYGYESSENRISDFPKYFDVSRNNLQWRNHLVSATTGTGGYVTLENAAYEFTDKNWGNLLIITLEFSPRDSVLEWAKQLCQNKKYKNHTAIIVTHSLIKTDSNFTKDKYQCTYNNGEDIFKKLIYNCPIIKFAICGHSCSPEIMSSRRADKNCLGETVHTMMFNPQAISGWNGNGGDGWLRIMEFNPDGKTIISKTYSPIFAFSQTTMKHAWKESDFFTVTKSLPISKDNSGQ